jgi:predicted aconitase
MKLEGRHRTDGAHLWVQTGSATCHLAEQHGEAAIMERAGGEIYQQNRLGMLMISGLDEKTNFATNGIKEIKLSSALFDDWMFGTVPDLVDAAVTGRFVSRRW